MPAKKAKEAQLEAARLAKELAAAAELEQQVDADLEASASQGVVLEQEEEPAAEAVQKEGSFDFGQLRYRALGRLLEIRDAV